MGKPRDYSAHTAGTKLVSNLAKAWVDPHVRFNTEKKEKKKNLPDRVKEFRFLVKINTRKK